MARVVIVDDQSLFREGLVALLRGHAEIDVVAEASSGEQALKACDQSRPDVVLMDMRMPGMDGPTCTREISARFPHTRVLALTTFDDDETVFAALRAGAAGYLLKDVSRERLVEAILAAARGESVVQPSVLSKVLSEFQRISENAPAASKLPHDLSERELAVLRVLMQGKSNKETGQALHIAEGTVKNHVTSILENRPRAPAAGRA
jgi:DNA-binding NarL/FixJ family response regulator